ncbi:Uncharacterised protein [Vibrio cholerae]|nr:Uncharacterised protein [Vibrio cholerae]
MQQQIFFVAKCYSFFNIVIVVLCRTCHSADTKELP